MCVCGCVCGSFRFDIAQTLVSRFLQLSSFFEDDGESPVESDETKVQTWSSQHYRNEPVVVVAAPRLQNLKSRLSEEDIDVQSLNMSMSSKRFSSYSNRKAEVEAVDVDVDSDVQYLNRSTTFKKISRNSNRNAEVEADGVDTDVQSLNSLLVESDDDDDDDDTETEDQDVEGGRTVAQNNDRGKGPPVIGGESSKTDGNEGPQVDKKADEFIAKFIEQIRLQRIESIKRSTRSARNSSR
ncbi:hypothetical protein JHK82_035599 [Glycine max]|nr:hypothetical protein JHK85_036325 [Glycine max]KAG4976259.1 hypothetical protein JHK86_035733 [Glycine max]KAG5112330.1 hypothetical protein JHK82_035599 [Glycine max]KAG5129610.1 hypothetical protein JHK84_036007 [Glycine max]